MAEVAYFCAILHLQEEKGVGINVNFYLLYLSTYKRIYHGHIYR